MADSRKTVRTTKATKRGRMTRAQRALVLKALADPRRFELLQQIARAGCPLGCAQALATLPISAATLSHHVKELETAGPYPSGAKGKFPLSLSAARGSGGAGRRPSAIEPGSCPGR